MDRVEAVTMGLLGVMVAMPPVSWFWMGMPTDAEGIALLVIALMPACLVGAFLVLMVKDHLAERRRGR